MSTKRKIEDYKGKKKIAIECKDDAEFEIIAKLLGRKSNALKFGFCIRCSDGDESDSRKNFENKGYTIYPASDFLEEETFGKKDIIFLPNEGCFYGTRKQIDEFAKFLASRPHVRPVLDVKKEDSIGVGWNKIGYWWLKTKNSNKLEYNFEDLKPFFPKNFESDTQKSFKFNIGDEIKAKPGGYYISSPQHFAESHKKQFPSERSAISGKITERTQAKGFNWYRCGSGNWITEEGVELVKENIPEYVECINTGYFISGCSSVNENNLKKGTIYKVSSKKPESIYDKKIVLETEKGHIEIGCNNYETLYKPSTKEAFDLQNKPKTMSEDIFCIKLNSQEELDAIMNFYKQKGFKELGDSHDYHNDYVVFIKMKDKKWQTSVCNDLNYPVKTLSELGIEVKSKSLVGRYLKALVDYPNAGSVLKGEIGIITKEYNGIPSKVDFPSQKYYSISNITYKNGESYELMPEGFKEFADNFYKKEEKEMLEMLPYPKYSYFKAVVVKDIHKKDIGTKGNMPDLIPKGYQTWFIDEGASYRERIFQNEYVVCPENNRWKANIPAEYFQIVEDEKYNDIPKEEWIPQVGEYIVYNNTDVLKVTKVEPCKSFKYWISHTPDSSSEGVFGWDAWKTKIRKARLEDIESIVHTLTDEEILEVCKQFYPKGTEFICLNSKQNATITTSNLSWGVTSINELNEEKDFMTTNGYYHCLYANKHFAKIISSPAQKEAKSWIQKQEEMLDDAIKQHPLTPKECYLSSEIIIPQVIKVQKTIQKITIESPTELDLKLKTIKPKQIQTIKI